MARFTLMAANEAAKLNYDDPNDYLWRFAEDEGGEGGYYWDEVRDVVVDHKLKRIVFEDGHGDSPEDNYLFRHYGGLISLLNEVDSET